ncbi:flagellar hook capping FlgD N-terminal domain-containing protein [Paracoccus sp. (in: a-proteobacteria)]|uniref:flagellar hook capping FlgD N-terminal domain-containing protein n=1 Tax=Paracoccus sp. TaxID=267 RepID=UPI0028A6F9E5|nr:flagellar hook capping FlgD N-terminal domain-containing protein [Paracoccus sp. (in: a-proteobacteria)]
MVDIGASPSINGINEGRLRATDSFGNSGSVDQFEVFLKMLTTQIKNQDPLNPMESTDFAVQLATFSGVEQQVQTNLLLSQLLLNTNGGDISRFSSWIGREVRVSSPVFFDNSPLTLAIESEANAENFNLITKNQIGIEVLRQNIDVTSQELDWQGRKPNGDLLPPGFYSFYLEVTESDGTVITQNVEAYSRVTGVEFTQNGPELVLNGGGVVPVNEVTALRE